MQDVQPYAYALRSLSSIEQQYAQIEREMLAIVFSSEKFKQFLYGCKVKIETNHKSIESIMKMSLLNAPKKNTTNELQVQKCHLGVRIKLTDVSGRHLELPECGNEEQTVGV